MLIDVCMVKKQIGLSFFEELKVLLPILLASLLMTIIVYYFNQFISSNHMKLIIGFIVGLLSYSFMIFSFNISNCRKELFNYGKFK